MEFYEGCLSLAGYSALVLRERAVRVECLDERGLPRVIEASGWYARILQHEIDRPDTGLISFAGPPYRLSGQDAVQPNPAPLLGQHNADVYCDGLGYSKEELVKLYQTGII